MEFSPRTKPVHGINEDKKKVGIKKHEKREKQLLIWRFNAKVLFPFS